MEENSVVGKSIVGGSKEDERILEDPITLEIMVFKKKKLNISQIFLKKKKRKRRSLLRVDILSVILQLRNI